MRFIVIFLFLSNAAGLWSQTLPKAQYPLTDDREIIGTRWKYTYTLHLESNTIIHQADKEYAYFLYFKYDYTYEQFLNGTLSKGTWSLDGNYLLYPFRHTKQFEIAEINDKNLILEFSQPNSTGTYQYHFVSVDAKDAPFVRPPDELPEVVVIGKNNKEKKKPWWSFLRRRVEKSDLPLQKEPTQITIELVGGGYYGGIDPVLRDYIQIKTDGRLIKEYQSVNNGLLVTKKNIPRAELERFAEYIVAQNFFSFERMYDCNSSMCMKRKRNKPIPIPLRLSVVYGARKKMVTISIWGEDDYHTRYVDYPKALDNIIDAIQRMATPTIN